MPEIFRSLCEENGRAVEVHSVTKGGRRLIEFQNSEDACTQKLEAVLSEHSFDTVILQDHSMISLLDPDAFMTGIGTLAKRMKALGARVILYETWGRKSGSPKLEENGWTHESMAMGVRAAYKRAAETLGAEISHAGTAFDYVLENYPELETYKEDKSHPSYLGSCLIAAVHYKTVFGELPELTETLKLPTDTVNAFLKAAASL